MFLIITSAILYDRTVKSSDVFHLVEKEDESSQMPQQINRPETLSNAASPDSMTYPEQLNETFNYSRLPEINIDDVIGDLQRDKSRTNENAVGLEEMIERIAE